MKTHSLIVIALSLLANHTLHAQIENVEYRFTGTIEASESTIDFHSPVTFLDELAADVGDTVTGTLRFPVPNRLTSLSSEGGKGYRSRIMEKNHLQLEVTVNEHRLSPYSRVYAFISNRASYESRVPVQFGVVVPALTQERASVLVFHIPSSTSDAAPSGTLLDGRESPLQGSAIEVSLNFTDLSGTAFRRGFPKALNLADIDLAKGFIRRGGGNADGPFREGLMFNIDSLTRVDRDDSLVEMIDEGPTSRELMAGQDLVLRVKAQSEQDLEFQWSVNGREIPGATTQTLTIPNAQASRSGTYRVHVSNSEGRSTTALARIQINSPTHSLLPLELVGWNRNVIFEQTGRSRGTDEFYDGRWGFFEAGYQGHPDGLPNSRTFTSVSSPEIQYALQPYDQRNSLWMTSFGLRPGQLPISDSLHLVKPGKFSKLAIAAASAGGGGKGRVLLHFADGTSQRFRFAASDARTVSDRPDPIAIAGLGRTGGLDTNDEPYDSGYQFGFGLYETVIDLAAQGLDTKILTRLEFIKTVDSLITGIFAVSGQAVSDAPVKLSIGSRISWPANGRDYTLEMADSIGGPWMPYPGTPELSDGQYSVPLDFMNQSGFYRLVE
jgi:hypothetical protein